MTALPNQPFRRFTLAEYLAFEEASEIRHEFHAGEALAMSGASPEHALIAANTISAFHSRMQGSDCRVYSSDLKISIQASDRICYPDASIVCGPLLFDPRDEKRHLVINPRVIVEVLSPTTEAYDRGEKFREYRRLASLEEYVLISQSEAVVETFVRGADGLWIIAGTYQGLEAAAGIQSLKIELKLGQVYGGVEFPPRPQVERVPDAVR